MGGPWYKHGYVVHVTRRPEWPPNWAWFIHRRPKPLGVKLTGDGFDTAIAARIAGERYLQELLNSIETEGRRGAVL